MCSKQTWFCSKHKQERGKIHSGVGAIVDAFWDCPNCKGVGFISLSLLDRFLLYLAKRMDSLKRKTSGC